MWLLFFKKFMKNWFLLLFFLLFVSLIHKTTANVEEFNEYANILVDKNIILKNSDYRVQDFMTRAEIAKLAVNISQSNNTHTCNGGIFRDVNNELWDLCHYIENAFHKGILSGNAGLFFPDKNITRWEAAKIFFNDKTDIDADSYVYQDEDAIDESFVEPIKKWITLGCISKLEKFRPNDLLSRWEAFKISSCIINNYSKNSQERIFSEIKITENAEDKNIAITAYCAEKWSQLLIFSNGKNIFSQNCDNEWDVVIPLNGLLPQGTNLVSYENILKNSEKLKSKEVTISNEPLVNVYGGMSSGGGSGYWVVNKKNNNIPSNSQTPDNQTPWSDNQVPDNQVPDNQIPDNQNPDNQAPDNKTPDNQTPGSDNQIPDNQNPDNQAPGSDNQQPENERMKKALSSWDSSGVTKEELIDEMKKFIQGEKKKLIDIKKEIFNLDENGEKKVDSLTEITWETSRHAKIFSHTDVDGYLKPIFVWNKAALRATLGIGGELENQQRVVLLWDNPFWSIKDWKTNDQMQQATINTINYLTKNASNPKIIVTNIITNVDAWKKKKATLDFVKENFSNATVLENCEWNNLKSCIADDISLVIMGQNCNNNIQKEILETLKEKAISVMYIADSWDTKPCTTTTLQHFDVGVETNGNYFRQDQINAGDLTSTETQEEKFLEIINKIDSNGFSKGWVTECDRLNYLSVRDCNNQTLKTEFRDEIDALRNRLRWLDAQATKLFANEEISLQKLAVLLWDKYREELSYPVSKHSDEANWYKAFFANSTVYNNRDATTVEKNLGNFVTNYLKEPVNNGISNTETPYIETQNIQLVAKNIKKDYAPWVYVWPWKTITITRTDSFSDVSASVYINTIRDTTRIYNEWEYNRPAFISTPKINIKAWESITLSNPYGGPLYFQMPKISEEKNLTFTVEWAGTHPTIQNPGDSAEIAKFVSDLENTKAEWVVVATDFLVIHSRMENWKKAVEDTRYNWDTEKFLEDIWTYLIKNIYTVAGYQDGVNLIPSDKVKAYCNEFGIDCESATHNSPENVQHAVSDTVAYCGGLCSGHPYDTSGPVTVGWWDGHEIGHNLQNTMLNIYGEKSLEVSNQYYPYSMMQNYNETQTSVESMMRNPPDRDRTTKEITSFKLIKESFAQANPKQYMKDKIWTKTWPYDDNNPRYNFYIQLASYAKYYNMDKMDTGYELFSMLNIMMREFHANKWNDAKWNETKTKLWMDSYSRDEANKSNGNDFMLITSSKVINKDMRPVFDMWWIDYSEKASGQVADMNLEPAEKLFFPLYDRPRYYKGEQPVIMSASAVYPYGTDYDPSIAPVTTTTTNSADTSTQSAVNDGSNVNSDNASIPTSSTGTTTEANTETSSGTVTEASPNP